jgi:hypothetical protein
MLNGTVILHRMEDISRTPDETLELLRSKCDSSLRYYGPAIQRMPSIPEQADHVDEVWNLMMQLGVMLAYIEGASDDKEATLRARDDILPRYTE